MAFAPAPGEAPDPNVDPQAERTETINALEEAFARRYVPGHTEAQAGSGDPEPSPDPGDPSGLPHRSPNVPTDDPPREGDRGGDRGGDQQGDQGDREGGDEGGGGSPSSPPSTPQADPQRPNPPGTAQPSTGPGVPSTPAPSQDPEVPPALWPPQSPPTPPGARPPADPSSTAAGDDTVYEIGGRRLTHGELQNVLALADYWGQVPEEAIANIDAYLQGRAVIAPATPGSHPGQAAAVPPAPGADPSAPGLPAAPDVDFDLLDEPTRRYIEGLQAQYQALESKVASVQDYTVAQAQQQQRQALVSRIESASQAYAERYALEPELLRSLQEATTQAGIFQGIYNRHQGNVEAAIEEAYTLMYWQIPELRQRAIDQAQVTAIQNEVEDRRRRHRQASLTSSGGSTPRTRPAQTMSREDRLAAAAAELAAASSQQ